MASLSRGSIEAQWEDGQAHMLGRRTPIHPSASTVAPATEVRQAIQSAGMA